MRTSPGIRAKLLSAFLLLVVGVVAVFSYSSYTRINGSLQQQAIQHGNEVIAAFSQLSGPYILESDYATIIDSANQLLALGNITQITITDMGGKVWLSTTYDNRSLDINDPFYKDQINLNRINSRLINGSDGVELEFISPIQTFGNPTYLLTMTMPLTEIEQQAAEQIRNTLLLALLVVVISALIAFWLSRVLTNPIRHLLHGTGEIIRGNYNLQIEVLSGDETGQLTDSFNQMTGHLKQEHQKRLQAQQSLIEHRDNLEKLVAQRTDQLTLSNQQLTAEVEERKWAEKQLQEERSQLAHRIAERTAELHQTNIELERAAKAKDEFLAAMSHELRTPLTAILGMSEVLKEQVYGELNPKQIEYLSTINESGNHLLELINDILDLAKIEAGKFEIRPGQLDFVQLAESSIRLVQGAASRQGLTIEQHLDSSLPTLIGDRRHLKQVLVNLLGNAIKFTPCGGKVGLSITTSTDGASIELLVWDTGIGISKDDQSRLFAPFVQVDSELSRQFSGTGLGLALVAKIIELHQGRISVQSAPGQGSRFLIQLPNDNGLDDRPAMEPTNP